MITSLEKYTIYDYFLMIALVSSLGFCLENIWLSIRKGYYDNRNMNLPFLLGYGIAIIFIYAILGTADSTNRIVYCSAVFLIVSIGEIILGSTVEALCNIYYWDYTSLPLHLTRYTSFFTSLGFAMIITFFMEYFFTPVMNYIHSHNSTGLCITSVSLAILLLADFIYSFRYMIKHKKLYTTWRLHIITKDSHKLELEKNRVI